MSATEKFKSKWKKMLAIVIIESIILTGILIYTMDPNIVANSIAKLTVFNFLIFGYFGWISLKEHQKELEKEFNEKKEEVLNK